MAEKIGLEAALDLGAWNSSIDKYIGGVKKMDAETGKTAGSLGKAFDSMGKSVLSVTGMMGKALAGAAAAAGAGIAAFTVNGIKGAAALEAQLSTVAAVLGKTTAEIEPLKTAVYDLALNPNLKVSVDEAAQAFEMLATNGLTMEQIIGGAAEATVLLANATKADFGTAADIATSAMSVFNIEAKDMMGAVNGIVGVTNASKFTINDYALALSQGGGVASAVGVEFRDFNTAIASMAPLFGSGSDAGTSFKTMLQRLVPQSNEASDAMRSLGLFSGLTKDEFDKTEKQIAKYKEQLAKLDPESKNFAARSEELNNKITVLEGSLIQGQNAFYNMDGSLKSMNEITSILNGALSGLSDEQRTAALSTIFGSDAMRAAVALGESGAVVYTDLATASQELGISQDELRKYIEGGITAFEVMEATMAQTDALQNAKTNTDNFESAMSILMDTIDAIGRQVGDLFLSYLKDAALALAELAGNAGPTIIAAFQNVIDKISSLSSYFQLVLLDGDLFNDYLADLPAIIQPVITIMGGLLLAFQNFQAGALGVDFPWEDIFPPWLAAIAYLIASAITFVTNNLAAFQGAIAGVAAVLAAAGIYQLLLGVAAAIAALNLPLLAIIGTAALVGAAWNANWFGIRDTTLAVVDAMTAAFFPLTSAIADFGSIALEEIVAFATGTQTEFDALALIWDGLKVSVANAFGGIVLTITGLLPVWWGILQGWGASATSWITSAIPTATTAMGEYTSGLIAKLTEADWAGTGTNMMTLLTNAVETAKGLLYTAFSNIVITVVAVLATIPWSTIGTNMMMLLTAAIEAGKGLLFAAFANIMITIQGIWNSIDWTALGTNILTLLTAGVEMAKGALLTLFAGLLVTIQGIWNSIDWTALGTSILTLLTAGAETAKGALFTLFSSALITIQGIWNSIDWTALGNGLLTKIRDGVESARGALVTLFSAILVTIQGIWNSINWTQLGTDLLTNIRAGVEAARGALLTLFSAILVTIQAVWNSIDWQALGNGLLTKVRAGIEAARGALLTLFANILVTVQGVWNSIDWQALGTSLLTLLQDGVESAKAALLAAFTTVTTAIKDAFTSVDWAQIGLDILSAIGRGIGTAMGALVLVVGALVLSVAKLWEIDWGAVGQLIIDGIKAGVNAAKALFLTVIGGVATSTADKWTAIDWDATGQAILNGIKAGVDAVKAGFLQGFNQIAGDAVGEFEDIEWTVLGANIINWIKSGVSIAGGALLSLVKEIAQDAWDKFTSIDYAGAGKAIIDGVISGISDTAGDLYDKIVEVAKEAWESFNESILSRSPSRLFAEGGRNIVDGIIMGINQRTGALNKTIGSLINADSYSAAAAQFRNLVGSISALSGQTGDSQKDLLADLDKVGKEMDARFGVLKLLGDAGLNPALLGDLAKQPLSVILSKLTPAVDATVKSLRQKLVDEQARMVREFALAPILESLDAAIDGQAKRLGELSSVTLSGFLGRAGSTIKKQLDSITAKIKEARDAFMGTGDRSTLDRLLSDRAGLIDQYEAITRRAKSNDMESALKAQLELIKEAQALGIDTKGIGALGDNAGIAEMLGLSDLEAKVAARRLDDLRKQISGVLSGVDAMIDSQAKKLGALSSVTLSGFLGRAGSIISGQLDSITAKIKEARDAFMGTGDRSTLDRLLSDRAALIAQMEGITKRAGNSDTETALKAQLELIKEAQALGVSVTGMSALKDGYGMADLLGLSDLEAKVAAKRLEALRKQIADTITGNEKALKLEKEMAALSAFDAKIKSVQAAAGKRYYDQVLAPIYAKLQDTNLLEAQRAELMAQYRKEAARVQQLQQREAQADFLNEQVDLLKQVNDLGLDPAYIFKDIKLGLGASVSDLMTVTERIAMATIAKLQKELGLNGGVNLFDRLFGSVDTQRAALDKQRQILDLVRELGADPNTIFGGESVASAGGLSAGVYERLQAAVNFSMAKLRTALAQEQKRLEREFTLQPILDKLTTQGRQLAMVASSAFVGFMKLAADGLGTQMSKLDEKISNARESFLTWGSPQAQAELARLIDERAALVEQMQRLSNAERGAIVNPSASYENALKAQLELIKEARALGASVGGFQILKSDFGTQDLINLGMIEKVISAKRIEDIKRQIAQALYLDGLDTSFDLQTKAGEAYKKRVLDPILANLNNMVLNDTERNRLIAQYNAEARNLVALDQRQLAFENELTRLRALQSELAGVQSAFGKRYADDVLGPILAKLEDANLLESQRAGLIAQYRAESEKILALKRQEEQLDFLKQQLALIKEVKDNDLNAAQIFNGLTLGINANIGDLLTATQRVVQAMIQKVQGELQIHSPSRVFMNIGKQTIDGLRLGVQKAMQQPIMAQSVPHAAVSSRTLNFAMGGVNIYNGMDEVLFESRVQRIIERSLS